MKQTVGLIFIVLTIPIILLLGNTIFNEYSNLTAYEKQLNEDIQLPEIKNTLPAKMFDQNGNLFNEEYVEWREPIDFKNVPEIIKQLYILSEDTEFYQHIGFDLSAIARAVVANSSSDSIEQGGSTITQQLVRLRYLTTEKTYERKLMELFYAYKLEQLYDKEAIFEMYLNEMYFGNKVYGIGSAAKYYFQKPLEQLSIAQMAFIAAIPNNPTLYDPLVNFDNTKSRQERLLNTLAENNVITKDEAALAKKETIVLSIKSKIQQHPAYSGYVLEEFKSLIAFSEGFEEKLARAQSEEERKTINDDLNKRTQEVLNSGVHIYTALDPVKQAQHQKSIDSILTVDNLQASAVVVDNKTREIISIYGGKNYKKFDFNRAYQAVRQPGSSFKPLMVYAPLFETTNYTSKSIVSGSSICIGNFCPKNYGGAVYGNVTISTAFKQSYNTSAVRLLNTIGIDTGFQYIDRFHFNSIVEQDHSYAAALGGLTYGVTTLEMADAYSSFIDGNYQRTHSIRKVLDTKGNVLYSWPTDKETIWSPKTVNTMRSLLRDVVTSGTGVGLNASSNYLGAKTGTTNDYKDFWLAGLTDEYTAAVWIGFDQPKQMQYLEDDQIHFKIFNNIMK